MKKATILDILVGLAPLLLMISGIIFLATEIIPFFTLTSSILLVGIRYGSVTLCAIFLFLWLFGDKIINTRP